MDNKYARRVPGSPGEGDSIQYLPLPGGEGRNALRRAEGPAWHHVYLQKEDEGYMIYAIFIGLAVLAVAAAALLYIGRGLTGRYD